MKPIDLSDADTIRSLTRSSLVAKSSGLPPLPGFALPQEAPPAPPAPNPLDSEVIGDSSKPIDSQTIAIQPFDGGSLALIEKAIATSDIGFTPNNDGKVIRITAFFCL